jgi:hypothetical protein
MKFEDGTPASSPQMAHDVSSFLNFLESHQIPDFKLHIWMTYTAVIVWFALSWTYVKYHEFNHHSCKIYY